MRTDGFTNDSVSSAQAADATGEATLLTKEAVRAYFDRLAPCWDDRLIVDESKINRILDAAGVKPGSHVLDVACGTGVLFPFYERRAVACVTAVDLSPEMAKRARSKALQPGFDVRCGDIETMAVDGRYDCCVVYNAFPHFPDPARLIGELTAWLSSGGRLTVAHSMSVEQLNRHHSGQAAPVSRGAISAEKLAAILRRWYRVDTIVSDDGIFIVSGVCRR